MPPWFRFQALRYARDNYKQLIIVFQQFDYIQMSLRILEAGVSFIICEIYWTKKIVRPEGGIGGLELLTWV